MKLDKPSDIHSKSENRWSRRQLMRSLSAAGFSTVAIQNISAKDIKQSSSDQVPIPLDISGDTIINVDAGWYNQLERARRVKDRLDNRYFGSGNKNSENDIYSLWLDAEGDKGVPQVNVVIDSTSKSKDETRGKIPERVDDVPVVVEEADPETKEDACDEKSKSDKSEIPGGLKVYFAGKMGLCREHSPLEQQIT